MCADFNEFWGENKRALHLKKCANFHEFGGETTKKSAKKQFLLTNSGVITSVLGVSGLELYSSGTKPVTFFGAQSSLGGHDSRLGGTSSDLGGYGPGMSSVVSGLLQVYSNLSNCNYQRWSPRGHILKSLALASKPQVLGLGLEALGPRKLPCPRLEDSTIFEQLKFC